MGNLLKILGHNCMDQNTNFSDEIFLDFDNVGKAQNLIGLPIRRLLVWEPISRAFTKIRKIMNAKSIIKYHPF